MESKTLTFFNRLSFIILVGTIFCSFFFFVPFVGMTLTAAKGFLFSIGITLSLFCLLVSYLGEGAWKVPREKLIIFAAAIPFLFFISSLFSYSRYISLFGSGFEIGTFGSMLTLFFLFFLSSIYFQTEKRLWYFLGIFFVGGLFVALFQLLYFFIDLGNLFPHFFQGISGNLVGSWNDLALFFGLMMLISIFTLEYIPTKKFIRIAEYFLLVISLFFIVIINMPLVWILLGVFSVIIFVYKISLERAGIAVTHGNHSVRKFPLVPFVIILLSFLFLCSGNTIGNITAKYIHFSNSDVRPSLSVTSSITYKALKHNVLLGTGPNTFSMDWDMWRPKDVAQTVFWNTTFQNGYGIVPTFLATTGILGFLILIIFLVILFIRGFQSFRIAIADTLSNYFILTTLMILIYSWVTVICYTPNIVMLIIAFASSGVLIGILVHKEAITVVDFSYLNDPRKSFFSILGVMVLILSAISLTYLYTEKFASTIFFSQSLNPGSTLESLTFSEGKLSDAIRLDKNDAYYRTLSQVYIAEINDIATDKNLSADTVKATLQQLVNNAQAAAVFAVNQNSKEYVNYLNLGNIYASLVPLSVSGSYESATAAYAQAALLTPNNPSIPLAEAQLEYSVKNEEGSKSLINQALSIKSNYTDALFFLSQIEISDSDWNNAINTLQSILVIDPTYVNARYLLAQTYEKVGRTSDATAQYKILQNIAPDNQDIKNALSSLSATPVPPPTDSTTVTTSKLKSVLKAKH